MANKIIVIALLLTCVFPSYAKAETAYTGAVRKIDLPLVAATQFNQKQPLKKSFEARDLKGWLSADSNWYIEGTVTHQRLRCASYELGIQLGKGSPGCLNIEWLTDVQYGTRKKHCNSATLVHVGGGEMPELRNILKDATCVKIITRCTGTCDRPEK